MIYGLNFNTHTYSLATTSLNKDYVKRFLTRDEANKFMYKLINKNHLKLVEV